MNCRVTELKHKDVINSYNGCKIGTVDDVEIDTKTAHVCSIIIYGNLRFFGLMGRHDDFVIPWELIEIIGEDAILVKCDHTKYTRARSNKFFKIFKVF